MAESINGLYKGELITMRGPSMLNSTPNGAFTTTGCEKPTAIVKESPVAWAR